MGKRTNSKHIAACLVHGVILLAATSCASHKDIVDLLTGGDVKYWRIEDEEIYENGTGVYSFEKEDRRYKHHRPRTYWDVHKYIYFNVQGNKLLLYYANILKPIIPVDSMRIVKISKRKCVLLKVVGRRDRFTQSIPQREIRLKMIDPKDLPEKVRKGIED